MKLIIDVDSAIKSPNCLILEQPKFIYMSGVHYFIEKTSKARDDVFVIIKKDNLIFNYDFFSDVFIDDNSQVFIIKKDYYSEHGVPILNSSLINSLLFRTMFESVVRVKNPMYMIISLANYIGSGGFLVNEQASFLRIKISIRDNFSDCEFNLNKLCDLVYMSRRKVQYILSSYNDNFLSLLSFYRVNYLKNMIDENMGESTLELINLSGFRTYQTANRLFKKYVGVSIGNYKKSKL